MKKIAFTLVEILIVIVIIGVLLLGFRRMFEGTDRNFMKSQLCFNETYGDVREFFDSALTSRSLYSGNILYNPTKYIIAFDTGNGIFTYSFNVGSNVYTYKTKKFRDTKISPSNSCYGIDYFTSLTGDSNLAAMGLNAGNIGTIVNPGYILTGSSGAIVFTGNIMFRYCTTDTKCKDVGKLVFDRRVGSVMQDKCLLWNVAQADGNQKCKSRTLGY